MTVGGAGVVIGVLLPDVLGTYSDVGNAVVLAERARWRGIDATVVNLTASDDAVAGCDLYLLGGGEDAAQLFAVDWLRGHPKLLSTMRTRAVTLAVCAGMQILGHRMRDARGKDYPGVGLLDVTTAARRRRVVGEIVTICELPDVGLLTGFENHQGATRLGPEARPLGRVVRGVGNGTARGSLSAVEGAMNDRIIGTYLHGPVLARNPMLADHLLRRVTGITLPALELPDQVRQRRIYLDRRGSRRSGRITGALRRK
jgi:CobQ-like glutamine amidotransferase family enzyme